MRILHIVGDIGISNGVMSVILNYLKNMPKTIHFDIAYFVETKENWKSELLKYDVCTYKIQTPGAKSFTLTPNELFYPVKIDKYQILHIHLPYLASIYAKKAKKMGVKAVFVHCHSTWFSLDRGHALRNRLFNVPTKYLSDLQIACGQEAGKFWYKKDFLNLPNAIDVDKFSYHEEWNLSIRHKLNIENKFVIGHIGRVLPPQKNHIFLIKIFAEIEKKRPDSVLLLVGAEPNDDLTKQILDLGIQSKVLFLGKKTDVNKYLSAMDVFVFPSLYEGLPVALLEAQASGLQCFASDKITSEVAVLKNLKFISLSEYPSVWAEMILKTRVPYNRDVKDAFATSKWNIRNSSSILADMYFKYGNK